MTSDDSQTDSDDTFQGEVFEGPEKKLEVFFSTPASEEGFRGYDQTTWSDMLLDACCSILHRQSNAEFDAYLLSESSMFVYPSKVILKTCGTTGLLLVLPKLLALADRVGVTVENVHYGRYRYKFPELQHFPHASFEQERSYLSQHFSNVQSRVIGPAESRCWYVLCARPEKVVPAPTLPAPREPLSPRFGEDIFEIAMENLSADVCSRFFCSTYPSLSGKDLAAHMTQVSGINELLPRVDIDDWAFKPCGYSMNGQRDQFYYTIHITPEKGFSYASFETNDPQYRQPKCVDAVVAIFAPAILTVTLTTRRVECELPSYMIAGFDRTCMEVVNLDAGVSVCSMNFCADSSGYRKRKVMSAKPAILSEGLDSVVCPVKIGSFVAVA